MSLLYYLPENNRKINPPRIVYPERHKYPRKGFRAILIYGITTGDFKFPDCGDITPEQRLPLHQCFLDSQQEIAIVSQDGLRRSVEFLQLGCGKSFILGQNRFGGCPLVIYDT